MDGETGKLIQGRDDNIVPSGYPGLSFTFGEACGDAPPLQMLAHAAQIAGISFLLSEKLTLCFGCEAGLVDREEDRTALYERL